MSHFTVLVISKDIKDKDKNLEPHLTGLLDPFWELDLSGEEAKDDYRATFSDQTAEIMSDWADGKGTNYKGQRFDEKYPSFDAFVEDYYGYVQNEEGCWGYYSNPNAKWDWWSLGGRWRGMLKLKQMETLPSPELFNEFGYSQSEFEKLMDLRKNAEEKFEKLVSTFDHVTKLKLCRAIDKANEPMYRPGVAGEPGVFSRDEPVPAGRCDSALKGDIDFQGMEDDAAAKAEKTYDKFEEVTKGLEAPVSWAEFREKFRDIEEARVAYHALPWVKAMCKSNLTLLMGDDLAYYCVNTGGREKFIQNARNCAFSCFAVLKDGEWHQRGEMGWFGVAHDEKDGYDWEAEFKSLVEGLSDDTLLSVVDCHI